MAGTNTSTSCEGGPKLVQQPNIGTSIKIPLSRLDDVAWILRIIISLGDEFASGEEESTEADTAKRYNVVKRNLREVASFTKELLASEGQ